MSDGTEYLRQQAASEDLAAAQIRRQMAQEELERFRTSAGDERTLLDWFAGQALGDIVHAGEAYNILLPPEERLSGPDLARAAASCAYMYADAMIAERAKR